MTSCLRTRPSRPVPSIVSGSTSCSSAMRCTTGEWRRAALGRDPAVDGGAGRTGAGSAGMCAAGGGATGWAGAGGAAGAPFDRPRLAGVSGAIRASVMPTSTVTPICTQISTRRPAAGDGISVSILSVETSAIVSSASTRSPGCLCHSTTVPSATETPIWGIVTSTIVTGSVLEELTAGLPDAFDGWQHRGLKRRRERDRTVR